MSAEIIAPKNQEHREQTIRAIENMARRQVRNWFGNYKVQTLVGPNTGEFSLDEVIIEALRELQDKK